MKVLTLQHGDILAKGIADILDKKKVEKQAGYRLSKNDYSDEEKNKVRGIENGAQVNIIEQIKVNNVSIPVTSNSINIDMSGYATKSEISSVYKARGNKASLAALPTSGNTTGDVWNVLDTGANYVWIGSTWDKLSETIDLDGYATKEDLSKVSALVEEATQEDIQNIINGLFKG